MSCWCRVERAPLSTPVADDWTFMASKIGLDKEHEWDIIIISIHYYHS